MIASRLCMTEDEGLSVIMRAGSEIATRTVGSGTIASKINDTPISVYLLIW